MDKLGPQKLADGSVLAVEEVIDLGRRGSAVKLSAYAMTTMEMQERVLPFNVLILTDDEYETMVETPPADFDLTMQKIMVANFLNNGRKFVRTWNIGGVQNFEAALAHIVNMVEEAKEVK